MKIGLVLEGGGMRGLYTAGVIDCFIDNGIGADVICGTSAGVTFGINLPSRQKGRVLRYNTALAGDRRYISLRSLLTTGNIVNKDFAYDLLPNVLDPFDYDAFKASGTVFFATVTNTLTGEAEYMKIVDCLNDMDIIRASASLPFLSRKVVIDGVPYLDGGISDNIPLDKCLAEGCDKVIVVLTHPAGYVKTESLYMLSRLLYPRDKALQRAFATRNSRYNARLAHIEELERQGKVLALRPSREIAAGRLEKDPDKLRQLHALGLTDTLSRLPEIKSYLSR